MITNYEEFFRVSEDGHIWWLLKDAIRLGAGFLPVRDDQDLKTELRAPNQRALVNGRTLIGAFGSDRYLIEPPMTIERDGFRYVDAGEFLAWLSQYIAQTQAKIAFPNELARKIKKAKAKAAALKPQSAIQEFESLTLALEDWFDNNLDDLPQALRQRLERDFFLLPWDGLSPDQRRSKALQWDYWHDPAKEQERQYVRNLYIRSDELQEEIEQWQSVATPTASELALKESRLKELQQERDRVELQIRQGRGDYYPDPKHPMADKEAIPSTDFIAYPKVQNAQREKGGRPKSPLAEAVEMAYLHFHETGDLTNLQPGNIRSFLKSFKSLANDESQSSGFGNRKIRDYIAERIKEVKIPRAGECFVQTQDRTEGRKINPGQRYSQKTISKLLAILRKKHPLPY